MKNIFKMGRFTYISKKKLLKTRQKFQLKPSSLVLEVNQKRGYTLIELLIIIAVAGILISAIMTFFLINFRTFNRETDDLRAQAQASKAMEFVVGNIMGSRGVVGVIETSPRFVAVFKMGIDDYMAFVFDGDLYYGISSGVGASRGDAINNATTIVAEHITDFFISSNSRVITVQVTSTVNGNVVELESKVSLRNQKGGL